MNGALKCIEMYCLVCIYRWRIPFVLSQDIGTGFGPEDSKGLCGTGCGWVQNISQLLGEGEEGIGRDGKDRFWGNDQCESFCRPHALNPFWSLLQVLKAISHQRSRKRRHRPRGDGRNSTTIWSGVIFFSDLQWGHRSPKSHSRTLHRAGIAACLGFVWICFGSTVFINVFRQD